MQESGRPYGLDLAYLAALAGGGRLVPPPIAREAGWREAGAVLTALRRGAIAGKAVLRPD
ncbi:MAG TPA: hypothetical protein VFL91_00895 [Thermomicrobiales bacterium]|nr:hypothetical protein [Thermomicrobiales bacterium]